MIERMRSHIQVAEISFLHRVSGLSFIQRMRRLVIQKEHIERIQLRWLSHLVRVSPGHLPGEMFLACSNRSRCRMRRGRVRGVVEGSLGLST